MPRFWLFCFAFLFLFSCHQKSVSLSGDGPVTEKEFSDAFPLLTLPYYAADTNVQKIADTTTISRTVFTQFVPDTSFQKFINKDVDALQVNPVGRIEKEDGKYFLATITQKKRVTLVAFLLGKKKKYLAALQLVTNRHNDDYTHSILINREPTFTISREKKVSEGIVHYTRNGYAYNNATGAFIKVVDDTNEDQKKLDLIINPIDTFARKNKYSGDYAEDKKNFISFRDGKNPSSYIFFVHFEKEDGNCTGELKGDMVMRSTNKGYYQESGDPCVIDFTFEGNEITLKEQGNCGNHRGITCYFDDTFHKKKETKQKKIAR